MKRMAVDAAKPGMRLALDVCDGAGRVLVAAGAELGAAMLASLSARGIAEIAVEEALSAVEIEARRQAAVARLAYLFRRVEDDPLMARLHDAVRAYRLEQLR